MLSPYRIDVPDADLDDLRERLGRTRFPNEVDGVGWEQGVPLTYQRALVEYWRNGYDWRAEEARLNAHDQFVAEVDGQRIHFLHVRSPHPGALPLVLCHGWPSSVVEFVDAIGPLTDPPDPADAFDVVIPSLPGFGFSGPTSAAGWHPRRIAEALHVVMDALGHDRYGVQGGDFGSLVVQNMADLRPDRVVGLHVNYMGVPSAGRSAPGTAGTETGGQGSGTGGGGQGSGRRFGGDVPGYLVIQATRPQTIGYLLDDSPAGLAAWIVDRFREWSDCGGDVERSFTKDQLLTNVMAYWVTRTGASSSRLYWEMAQAGRAALPQAPVTVPTGVANFPGERTRSDPEAVARRYNLVHWTELPRGGHFGAFEEPELFAEDVRTFFRLVR